MTTMNLTVRSVLMAGLFSAAAFGFADWVSAQAQDLKTRPDPVERSLRTSFKELEERAAIQRVELRKMESSIEAFRKLLQSLEASREADARRLERERIQALE